jgi:hypothetical protein
MIPALCEVRVFSRRHQFAGTFDLLGVWHKAGGLIDYKTGNPNHVAADLQTAAYLGALLEMQKNGDTSDMLAFDHEAHRYTLDGVELPSVTQVLERCGLIDFSRVPSAILRGAKDRGTAVHTACHYFNENDLDLADFKLTFPEYWPYLSAWITFRQESGFALASSLAEIGRLSHVKRYSVWLRKDGRYVVEAYTNPRDYAMFLALPRKAART